MAHVKGCFLSAFFKNYISCIWILKDTSKQEMYWMQCFIATCRLMLLKNACGLKFNSQCIYLTRRLALCCCNIIMLEGITWKLKANIPCRSIDLYTHTSLFEKATPVLKLRLFLVNKKVYWFQPLTLQSH